MNPYLQIYQTNSVMLASPRENIIKLHTKMITELRAAQNDLSANDMDSMRSHIMRVQDILSYLRGSLDNSQDVSQNLAALYQWYIGELGKIFVNPQAEMFEFLASQIHEWAEVWMKASTEVEHNEG